MAVRIVLKPGAVPELMKSPEMVALIDGKVRRIAATAGPGHESETSVGRNRARGMVWTETFEAMFNEATKHTLTRALDAGR